MIRAAMWAEDGSNPTLVIGLTGENMARLMSDEPIFFDLSEMNDRLPDLRVLVVGGRTNEAIQDHLVSKLNAVKR